VGVVALAAALYFNSHEVKLWVLCRFLDFVKKPVATNLQEINERRTDINNRALQFQRPVAGIRIKEEEVQVGDVALTFRFFTPESTAPTDRLPVVVFYHGGGWVVMGNKSRSHEEVCARIAKGANAIVIWVDYRLAPEVPFPGPMEDAYNSLVWISKNAHNYNGDPERIAVAGDSAGGNLAAVVSLKARDEGFQPKIKLQLLLYPVTNYSFDTSSYKQFATGYFLTADEMKSFWKSYLVDTTKHSLNPYAAPLMSKDLTNLPDSLVITADYDVLRDEGLQYAEALKKAGVNTKTSGYNCLHGFLNLGMVFPDVADAAYLEISQFLMQLHK